MTKGAKTKAAAPRSGAGRPMLGDEVMKSRTVRMTDAQWEKCQRLGGGDFIRSKIDKEKEKAQ